MIAKQSRDIGELLKDTKLLEDAMEGAILDALRQHKAAGNPVATWQDGRVVWIQPQDLEIPPVTAQLPESSTNQRALP